MTEIGLILDPLKDMAFGAKFSPPTAAWVAIVTINRGSPMIAVARITSQKPYLIFASPSAAAAVCFGRSSNGREAWIHEASGLSYNAFQAQQLAPTDPETSPSDQ